MQPNKSTFATLLLLFGFPVGLFYMWRHKTFSKTTRWLITVFGSVALIWLGFGFYALMSLFPNW